MIEYATLINNGYRIENAQIKSVDFSLSSGNFTFYMILKGNGIGDNRTYFCSRPIGKNNRDEISGSENGIEYILRIMDVVGVSRFNDMKGKYVRIAFKVCDDRIEIIGNIIENKWFDQKAFFDESCRTKKQSICAQNA